MKRTAIIYLRLLPLIGFTFIFFLGALVFSLLKSFGYAPIYGVNEFPTLKYYEDVFSGQFFWTSAAYTFYYAFVGTALASTLGVILALAIRKNAKTWRYAHLLCKLPLMVPYLVGAVLAVQLLGSGGLIARISKSFGLIESTNDFPDILHTHAGWGIFAVMIWKQAPFVALATHSVLSGIGRKHEESAKVLGAGRIRIFCRVTLPLMLPGITAASLICFAYNFGVFELPFILGGGHPDTLSVAAWRYFNEADYTKRLSGLSLIMLMCAMSGLIILLAQFFYGKIKVRQGKV